MSAPALTAQNLRCAFRRDGKDILAVDNVSFEIARGETLALAGPSGSGKSTVARLVTRVIEPQGGNIELFGVDFRALHGADLRRRRRSLQMVFQDTTAAFSPRATVRGVLEDPMRIHQLRPKSEWSDRIAGLLGAVRLDRGLMNRSTSELSGGQRQRVAIARALACEPDVIVLDEALSAVDASRRAELVDLLLTAQEQNGVAYLFISHDMALIRAIAHRIAIMEHGQIVEEGHSQTVIDAPVSAIGRALVSAVPRLEFSS